jgi:hypothetical protein
MHKILMTLYFLFVFLYHKFKKHEKFCSNRKFSCEQTRPYVTIWNGITTTSRTSALMCDSCPDLPVAVLSASTEAESCRSVS